MKLADSKNPKALAEEQAYFRDMGAVSIHFRVIERLKGRAPDLFTANGLAGLEAYDSYPRRKLSLQEVAYLPNVRDLDHWSTNSDCTESIYARLGQRYVIFRRADGRVLGNKADDPIGPSYVPVAGLDDPWIQTVRKAMLTSPLP